MGNKECPFKTDKDDNHCDSCALSMSVAADRSDKECAFVKIAWKLEVLAGKK